MFLSCLGDSWTDHQGNSYLSHPQCPCPPINFIIQAHISLCKSQLLHLPSLLLLLPLLFLLLLILKLLLSKPNSWLSSKFCSQTKMWARQLIWQLIQ